MNEIMKKRIEEAAINDSKHYDPNVSMYSQGKQVGYIRGFREGAHFALSHQWISVEEALPEYQEGVLVTTGDNGHFFCHRTNNPNVQTDENGWCNYSNMKIVAWMPIPEYKPKNIEP